MESCMKLSDAKRSFTLFMTEAFENIHGITVYYDPALANALAEKNSVTEWVTVIFGSAPEGGFSPFEIWFFICTREDPEFMRLSEICDLFITLFTDVSKIDHNVRIPVYRWDELGKHEQTGSMTAHEIGPIGPESSAPDGTKFRYMPVYFTRASKLTAS